MRAYVLSIGSELLEGHLTDTNATFLAQELAALGISLLHVIQSGDHRHRLAKAISVAMADADLVVCTGGVGPTEDDLTREAIADVVGETPEISAELLDTIKDFFAARGLEMPERNAKQAWLIPSAEPLPNPVGTAPGWFVDTGQAIIVAMPGVPREMKRMWAEQVVPRLVDRMIEGVYRSTTLKTVGVGESALEEILHDLVMADNPVVATYAKDDGVHIRVTGFGDTEREALEARDGAIAEIWRRAGDFIYAEGNVSLADAILQQLEFSGLRLSIRDRGAGGQFAALVLSSPRAVAAIDDVTLLVDGGESAQELAVAAAGQEAKRVGLGITVEARPSGSICEGEVTIALQGPLVAHELFPLRAAYQEIQRRSALHAADVLLRELRRSSG